MSDPTDELAAQREQELRGILAELDQIAEERAQIEERTRDRAAEAVRTLRVVRALREAAELPAPSALVRELYWHRPEVHVKDIAAAIGVRSASEVIKIAGPGHFELPCRDGCGRIVIRDVASRTEFNSARSGYRTRKSGDPRICAQCREAHREQEGIEHADYLRRRAESDRLEQEAIDRHLAENPRVVRRYVEYEGLGGTFADPAFTPPH